MIDRDVHVRARMNTGELYVDVGAWTEPPFHVAYGSHLHVGDEFNADLNFVVVDDAEFHYRGPRPAA